ncbi:MAG: RNA-guided endonuclease InsQ/TnpB family protein [Candidatus Hodarchaeales archaeon]
MFHTYKIQVYPTEEQQNVLWVLSEKCRLLYNFALAERKDDLKKNQVLPSKEREYFTYIDQQNQLPALKRKNPEYGWVYSKVLQMTLKKLDTAYKSFFSLIKNGNDTARPPRFRGKDHFFTLCYNQSGFKYHENSIDLSHKHPSQTDLTFELGFQPKGKIKQIEIFSDYKERWFLAVNCEISPSRGYHDNGLYQAIDLGINNLVSAVNLKSQFIQITNKRPDNYWRKKIVEVQSKRDHCKKKSRKWHWYNRKLVEIKRKQSSQLKDFQHKISKVVVTNTKANTLIVGNLAVKQMARKKKLKHQKTLNYSLQNTGHISRFVQFLTYKAEKIGKKVVKIDEKDTTKTCCVCGLKKKQKLSERAIKCNCGNQMDRDLNSAVNIMSKFLQEKNLLHQSSVNEESFLHKWKGFLRYTANDKEKSSLLGFSGLAGNPLL